MRFLRNQSKMWNEWAGQAENGGVSVDKFAVVYDEKGSAAFHLHGHWMCSLFFLLIFYSFASHVSCC